MPLAVVVTGRDRSGSCEWLVGVAAARSNFKDKAAKEYNNDNAGLGFRRVFFAGFEDKGCSTKGRKQYTFQDTINIYLFNTPLLTR